MNIVLAYLQLIFIGLLIYGSVITFGDISTNTSLSGVLAPILAWFSGTGLRASLNSEDDSFKKSSIFMTIILLSLSYFWINSTSYWFDVNDVKISGKNLLIISFFIGFLSTTREISLKSKK